MIGYLLYGDKSTLCYASCYKDGLESDWPMLCFGKNILRTEIPLSLLNEGDYEIRLVVGIHNQKWIIPLEENASIYFSIQGNIINTLYWQQSRPGFFAPILHWEVENTKTIIQDKF